MEPCSNDHRILTLEPTALPGTWQDPTTRAFYYLFDSNATRFTGAVKTDFGWLIPGVRAVLPYESKWLGVPPQVLIQFPSELLFTKTDETKQTGILLRPTLGDCKWFEPNSDNFFYVKQMDQAERKAFEETNPNVELLRCSDPRLKKSNNLVAVAYLGPDLFDVLEERQQANHPFEQEPLSFAIWFLEQILEIFSHGSVVMMDNKPENFCVQMDQLTRKWKLHRIDAAGSRWSPEQCEALVNLLETRRGDPWNHINSILQGQGKVELPQTSGCYIVTQFYTDPSVDIKSPRFFDLQKHQLFAFLKMTLFILVGYQIWAGWLTEQEKTKRCPVDDFILSVRNLTPDEREDRVGLYSSKLQLESKVTQAVKVVLRNLLDTDSANIQVVMGELQSIAQ